MAEAAGGYDHEEMDRRIAADMISYDALLHRVERFREHVLRVASEEAPAQDDLIYTDEELIAAYDEAERAGEAVIAAYVEYKRALKVVNHLRKVIETPSGKKETEKRRNIGTGVLNLTGSGQEPRAENSPSCDLPDDQERGGMSLGDEVRFG